MPTILKADLILLISALLVVHSVNSVFPRKQGFMDCFTVTDIAVKEYFWTSGFMTTYFSDGLHLFYIVHLQLLYS